MGYSIVRNLKINRLGLSVTFTIASSNVRDYNDRLIFDTVNRDFKNINELECAVVDFSKNVLNGMIRLPRLHSINKRLQYLKNTGAIVPRADFPEIWEFKQIDDNVKKILTGEKRVKVPLYKISNNVSSIKETSRSYILKAGNGTKFLSKDEAANVLSNIPDMQKRYNLKLVEC